MKKRKDGRWVKAIAFNGKRVWFYSRAETERKAELDIQHQMMSYHEKEERGKTLLAVSEEWFDIHTPSLAYTTTTRYTRYMHQLNSYLDGSYIKTISTNDIEDILVDLADKQYSTKTIQDFLSVVRQIFKYAHKKHYVDEDVTFYITSQKGKPPIARTALNEADTLAVSQTLHCTFGLLAFFYLCTGLRKGEALALQWKDIDFEKKRISISKSVYFVGNTPHIKHTTKTRAGTRYVILLDCLAQHLISLRGEADDYVFSRNGKLIDKSYYTRMWDKYRQESGISASTHMLRHSYATLLFESGVSEKDTQALLGHSNISTTYDIYTHIRKSRMDKTRDRFNDYMAEMLCLNKTSQ